MYCPTHKTKMIQLFTSWVCDDCTPPVGQQLVAPQASAATSKVIKHKPCDNLTFAFLVYMLDDTRLEYRFRTGKNLKRPVSVIIGSSVRAKMITNLAIMGNVQSCLDHNLIVAGYLGLFDNSPVYSDFYYYPADKFLNHNDIYMTSYSFNVAQLQNRTIIQDAIQAGEIVLHSEMT